MNPNDLIIECIDDRRGMIAGIPNKIKITHVPTGLVAIVDCMRSQHKNRYVAMSMIEYGLAEMGYGLYDNEQNC